MSSTPAPQRSPRRSRSAQGTSVNAESTTFTQMTGDGESLMVKSQAGFLTFVATARAVFGAGYRYLQRTVTAIGWFFVLLAATAIPVGLSLNWAELTFAGFVALILILLAIPFLFGGRSYAVDFVMPQDRVVAGTPASAFVRVTNVSSRLELPGRVDIPIGTGLTDLVLPLMRPGQVYEDEVIIPAQRRGVIDIGPISTVRTDPIGSLRNEHNWVDVRKLYVHPVTVSVPSTSAGFIRDLEGNPTTNLIDSDISFHAIRQYVPGDGQRHIHWKSTAKTGQLMVRQFEESRRSRIALILALNAKEYADADQFETAVSVVGSLGIRAIRDGRDLAVVTSADLDPARRKQVRSIRKLNDLSSRTLLDELCSVNMNESALNLTDVCTMVSQVNHDLSVAFIVCGSTMTPKQLQMIRLRLPQDIAVVALVCDPDQEAGYREFSGISVISIALLDDLRALLAGYAA